MSLRSKTPLVSVMMPAFNAEQFLPAALDSLLAQTYDNWEAVVVDDGSADGTASVLQKYAARDARIKPILATHGGRGRARNLALKHCEGEYVAMLDADDVATPDRFMKQTGFLEQNPDFGAVSGQCVSFNGEPLIDRRKLMPWPTDPIEIQTSLVRGRMRILNGGAMLRRRVFEEFGGYRIELHRAQDYEFFRRLAIGGVRLGALDDIVLLYRQENLIPSAAYYLESESFKHYANAIHDGYQADFISFQNTPKGKLLYLMTHIRYGYLFAKLVLRYRQFR